MMTSTLTLNILTCNVKRTCLVLRSHSRYFIPRPLDLTDWTDLTEAAPARGSVSMLTPNVTCLTDLSSSLTSSNR